MISNLNINILSKLKAGPWGGGNQFLKSLHQELKNQNHYTESPTSANVIILDSYQQIIPALILKHKNPHQILVHRLGPIFHLHRGSRWYFLDKIIISVANQADWVIFQSLWTKVEALKLGFTNQHYSIIKNAPNSKYFNNSNKKNPSNSKIKLIATSWSTNPNKGFSFYEFLDNNLDFNKYSMTFIGNSPIQFKNIIQLDPLPSSDLAKKLKSADIMISAVKNDACSNSILEGLACSLPVIALNSGSNSELIDQGGELFNNEEELLTQIDLVASNLDKYRQQINIDNISTITNQYLESISQANPKPISFLFLLKTKLSLFFFNLYRRL